jgi:hypothetical protein
MSTVANTMKAQKQEKERILTAEIAEPAEKEKKEI